MGLFARVGRLFRGFIGLFISGLEESNPEALMDAARQEFREKMAQYNMALARMAGVAERLKGQVRRPAGPIWAPIWPITRPAMPNWRAHGA
jgi:hypothetical protein